MKTYFYEILEPYHAIIKAYNEDEVLKIYEEIVCDIEENEKDKFFENLEVISGENVKEQLTRCAVDIDSSRLMTQPEQEETFNSKAPGLILMEMP